MDNHNTKPLYKLENIAQTLHGENGCPWDRKQTHESLKKYLIEEAYEVIDAIEKNDTDELKEELGDVLYQVYAHCQLNKNFNIDDVAEGIGNKLVKRHPHVFGEDNIETADEVSDSWEKIKKKERGEKSILSGVPKHLPALLKASRVQEKVSRIGFDFPTIDNTIEKLEEELEELKVAVQRESREEIEDEFGDILFSIVNISRFIEIDPEECLQNSVNKFMDRFKLVEKALHKAGKEFDQMSTDELEDEWQAAKKTLSSEAE